MRNLAFVFCVFMLFVGNQAFGQRAKTNILFVFDCSNSMHAKFDKGTRIEAAKRILIRLVDSISKMKNVTMALRCYGHNYTVEEHNCKDTKLEVPFGANNAKKIIDFVKNVEAKGYTPIAYSLTQSAEDFSTMKTGKNIVLLITDGIEECDGDPCAVSLQLQSRNIFLKPYIVGIGLTEEKMKFFDCVGRNYPANNEKELTKALNNVLSQALNKTTVTVELLNSAGLASETDAEMNFTNAKNNKLEYNYYHTMNSAGTPDTFSIDPGIIYNLQVNTLPPITKSNITLTTGQNNVIKLNAARGTVQLMCESVKDYANLQCLIRQAGKQEIINVQLMNTMQDYLVGTYDIEVLSLPRLRFRNVKISNNETQKAQIPEPGRVEMEYLKNIVGSIYVFRSNKQEWVCDLDGAKESGTDLYVLQPGRYSVVYRPLGSNASTDTQEKSFNITSGGHVSLKIN